MGFTKYLAFHDMDELFVPYSSEDMVSLLNSLFVGNMSLAELRIPRYDFVAAYEDFAQLPVALRITLAVANSSKSIVKPEIVFEQGVHHTRRMIQQHYQSLVVPPSLCQVHHYRKDESYLRNDRVPKTFGSKFLARYEHVIGKLHVK
jgi:hypothetical protein